MNERIDVAVKSMKAVQAEATVMENRLMFIQNEVESLKRQKETLQKALDDKYAEAELRWNERDAKSRAMERANSEARAALEKDKADLLIAAQQVRVERSQVDKDKEEAKILKMRAEQTIGQVQSFIVAVQRAFSVLPTQ